MAEPLLTEDEYAREYGDLRYLQEVKTIEEQEVSQVHNFHAKKLQLVLAKSGIFHLSLKKRLIRFNNRLLELRRLLKGGNRSEAMAKFEQLRKEGNDIEAYLLQCRNIIRQYYNTVRKIASEEQHVLALASHHFPEYIDPEMNRAQREKAAALTPHIRQDLVHIMHVLVALDNLFNDELLRLARMIMDQIKRTNANIFNFAKVNRIFDEMNSKFEEVLKKASQLKVDASQTEKDIEARYEIVQRVLARN